MRSNTSDRVGLVDPSSPADSTGSRTSIRTMALVVLTFVIIALFSRFGSHPLSTSTTKCITEESDKANDPAAGIQRKIQPVDCAFLSALEDTARNRRQSILTYWNVSNYPNFLSMMSIPTQSWKIQKAKYMKLLLEANTEHFEKKLHGNSSNSLTFIAGFSGSSVTAGHDNYFHEAFPQVFYESLQPVFRAMGVNFTVRNHALGNNPCYPYDACIATHLGEDLDLLAWEQSMNCGRYPAPVDTFSRAAYSMAKKPTLLYLTSGGPVWTRKDCLDRNITTSGTRGPLTAAEKSLLAHTTAENALLNPSFTQNNFLKDDNQNLFVDRFAQLAPMAQTVFGAEEYKCLGPYNASFCEKTPGGGATHHPGKLMHKLRGENLAFFQLEMLLGAVKDLQKLTCGQNTTRTAVTDSPTAPPAALHMFFSAQLNLTYPPTRSFLPRSPSRIAEESISAYVYTFVVEYLQYQQESPLPPVPTKYNLPETAVPPTCHTSFEPRVSNALEEIILPEFSNWHSELSFLDKNAVEKSITQGRGYLDRKYIYTSTGVNSTLAVKVHVKGLNNGVSSGTISDGADGSTPIWLCEVQKGFAKYPSTHADLPVGADVFVEYHYKPSTAVRPSTSLRSGGNGNSTHMVLDLSKMTKLGLTQLKNECYRTPPVVPGDHRVVIVQNSDKIVNIAYFIAW